MRVDFGRPRRITLEHLIFFARLAEKAMSRPSDMLSSTAAARPAAFSWFPAHIIR